MPRKRKSDGVSPVVARNYIMQSSSLLSLSPELRNTIFELVCCDTKMVYCRQSKARGRDGMPSPPGFVMACKQIYFESAKVFYATASFEFRTMLKLRGWLNKISDDDLNMVQHVLLKGLPVESVHLKQEKKANGSLFWRSKYVAPGISEENMADTWVTFENDGVTIRTS